MGLERTFYPVSERVGSIEVCAIVYVPNGNIDCPIDLAFSVDLSTRDDTAGMIAIVGTIAFFHVLFHHSQYYGLWLSQHVTDVFSMRQTEMCNIAITSDDVLENVEIFNVTLERNGLDERIMLDPTQGQIVIIDNTC